MDAHATSVLGAHARLTTEPSTRPPSRHARPGGRPARRARGDRVAGLADGRRTRARARSSRRRTRVDGSGGPIATPRRRRQQRVTRLRSSRAAVVAAARARQYCGGRVADAALRRGRAPAGPGRRSRARRGAGGTASRRTATSETAAVRRFVRAMPSTSAAGASVAASNTDAGAPWTRGLGRPDGDGLDRRHRPDDGGHDEQLALADGERAARRRAPQGRSPASAASRGIGGAGERRAPRRPGTPGSPQHEPGAEHVARDPSPNLCSPVRWAVPSTSVTSPSPGTLDHPGSERGADDRVVPQDLTGLEVERREPRRGAGSARRAVYLAVGEDRARCAGAASPIGSHRIVP